MIGIFFGFQFTTSWYLHFLKVYVFQEKKVKMLVKKGKAEKMFD